jgi:hypothetical protein
MSTLSATPSTLSTVLAKATAGDAISLAPGSYGDVTVSGKAYSPAISLTSADPANPAVLRTLTVKGLTGLHVSGLTVAFTPDMTTLGFTQAVTVDGCADVTLDHLKVKGGLAVNGVPETATTLDSTDNVIGRPCGRGVTIMNSHDVALTNSEVTVFDRGVLIASSQSVLIQQNDIHGLRHTGMVGGGFSDVTIDGNLIRDADPWRVGQTPVGDHSDMLAFWSGAGQTTPNARVKITNNVMLQNKAPSLGMWFQGGGDGKSPFTDFTIAGNLIAVPNLQGIALWQAQGGTISGNTLVQTQVPQMTAEQVTKQLPTVLLLDDVSGVTVTNNALGVAMADRTGLSTASGNTLTAPSKDGGVTEIKAWLASHQDMAKMVSALLPAAPAPAAQPDPRDAQIADLAAKLAAASAALANARGQVGALTQQLADAKAAQMAGLAQVSTLQAQLAAAQAALTQAQADAAAISAKLATDEAKLAGLRAAVAP